MNAIETIALISSRVFASSVWYETENLDRSGKLYAKARELISGDRTEMIAQQEIDKSSSNCNELTVYLPPLPAVEDSSYQAAKSMRDECARRILLAGGKVIKGSM